MRTTRPAGFLTALLGLLLAAAAVRPVGAHDIPNDLTVRMLAKPAGDRMRVLVRAPLGSMRDVEFPVLPSGYLDVASLGQQLPDIATTWVLPFIEVYEDGERLGEPRIAATQISILSDRSFADFDSALAHVREPLPANAENLVWEQVFFDVLLEYPIRSDQSAFAVRPGLEHLASQVVTSLDLVLPDGVVRAYQLHGDQGVVPLDPSWSQAAWRFVKLGFWHILDGRDHLLFLLCLVIPFRRLRPLIWIVTAFTLAHSITLIASALGFAPQALWFPPLIETLIAASILYMALENIVVREPGERRRWMFAFGFGLIHGFGFAFALQETLQFAGSRVMTSLLAFNVGVELGQLLVIALLVPALEGLFRFVVEERMGTIVLSALVAHTGWHWTEERFDRLSQYDFGWDGATTLIQWAARLAIAAGAVWFLLRRFQPSLANAPRAIR